jgi:hypothetical protein
MRIEITKDADTPNSWTVLKLYLDQHGPEMVKVIKGDVVVGEITAGQVETVAEMSQQVQRAKRLERVPRLLGHLVASLSIDKGGRSAATQANWFSGVVAGVCGKDRLPRNMLTEPSFSDVIYNDGVSVGKAILDTYQAVASDSQKE